MMIRKTALTIVAALAFAGAAFAQGADKVVSKDAPSAGLVARTGSLEKARSMDVAVPSVKRAVPLLKKNETRLSPLPDVHAGMQIHGHYVVTAYDHNGKFKWQESFDNLITTVGKNAMLDQYLAGSSWSTGTVYMMLKGTGTAVAGDTMASHASWSELNISASSGIRQAVSLSAASSGSKATSSAVAWSITSSGTVYGVALVVGGTSTNANTTGTLFSAGDFGSSRSVVNGDTLNVTWSASLTMLYRYFANAPWSEKYQHII